MERSMEDTERKRLEQRLREINKRPGILEPKPLAGSPPEETDVMELLELEEERQEIKRKLGLD